MNISTNGVNFLKQAEDLKLETYADTGKVPTIGYGHTGRDVTPGKKITKEEAEKLLSHDLSRSESVINDCVKVQLSQDQYDALVSFIHNVGTGAFRSSTLLKRLNEGSYQAAQMEFLRWNHVGKKVVDGLTNRRKREAALFGRCIPSVLALPLPLATSTPHPTPLLKHKQVSNMSPTPALLILPAASFRLP